MNENELLIVWVVKILVVIVCAVLYRLGGQYEKALRRFVMPGVYFLGCYGISVWKDVFSPEMFISLPLLIGSLCLGYGGEDIWTKIRKRFVYGLCLSLSFLPFAFVFDSWVLYVYHTMLCITSSVAFGVWNPFKEAVAEEAMIATLSLIIPIMMI